MLRIDTQAIAAAILSAPGWARVGITAPKAGMREDAANELARAIADMAERTPDPAARLQTTLPL